MTLNERGWYPPQEQSLHAKNLVGSPDAGLGVPGRCAPREDLPVTPEEDDAWNHMTMIAGSTV